MSLYIDKYYKTKESTPLTWHTFNRFVITPVAFLINLAALVNINFDVELDSAVLIENIILILALILEGSFFIGSFNWKKYAWYSAIAIRAYATIIYLIYSLSVYDSIEYGFVIFFIAALVEYLEYVYYKKRKYLFNGTKTDTIENLDDEQCTNNNNYNQTNGNQILFCRKCGAKLEPDSVFCSKCGEKVEG